MNYLISSALLFIILQIYFFFAKKYTIIDKPNERSSHSKTTFRGGGIIFPIAALLWFFLFGFQQGYIVLGVVIIALISFLDDLKPVSNRIRIAAHLLAVSLLYGQLQVFGLPWYIVVLAYILTIGWINTFNFMDGINGITPLYSLIALGSFYYLSQNISFISPDLLIVLTISVLIFSWFNVRKRARVFAGDVGSVSLAFLLACFMISLIKTTNEVGYILFFAVYAIDSVYTIVFRLFKKENIFKAHRSHLYQYLANEMNWPHLKVSVLYALAQLIINAGAVYLIEAGFMSFALLLFIFAILSGIYLLLRFQVSKKLNQLEAES